MAAGYCGYLRVLAQRFAHLRARMQGRSTGAETMGYARSVGGGLQSWEPSMCGLKVPSTLNRGAYHHDLSVG